MGTCLIGSIIAFIPSLAFENITLGNLLWKNELLRWCIINGIGFLLQAYSQQNLSPAPVAIIFSLEGVFAAIFGWILLNQFLSELKIFGIALILVAVIFSQLAPIYDKKPMDETHMQNKIYLLKKIDDTNFEFGIEVLENHLNSGRNSSNSNIAWYGKCCTYLCRQQRCVIKKINGKSK